MNTPRHTFGNMYIWFFENRSDAELMATRFNKWRHTAHYVVHVENYGFLVRNVHNRLFDSRGRLPDEMFSVNAENNTASIIDLPLTGS